MLLILLASVALAAEPTVRVSWKGPHTTLAVEGPGDEVVNDEAPASLQLRWEGGSSQFEGLGDALAEGLPLPPLRGERLSGRLEVGLCDVDKTHCRFSEHAVEGYIGKARRGEVELQLAPVPEPESAHGLGGMGRDAAVAAEEALARAAERGELALLDFGAVWCPPCNLLSAEVLSDPQSTEGFVLATLDVDDPSSFELKHRYSIGSYPTVVITDAEGKSLARYVGYQDREDFLAWLESVRAGERLPEDPAEHSPERAAEVAAELARQQHPVSAVQPWLDRAEESGAPGVHIARLHLDPTPGDVEALLAAEQPLADWIWAGLQVVEADAELAEQVVERAEQELIHADPLPASDLLYLLARLQGDRPDLYAAAAAVQRALMSGEPERDKGLISGLASLVAAAGDVSGAVGLLEDAADRWPEEPTFFLALARLHLEHEAPEAARAAAEAGMEVAWGDNRLRMAAWLARSLKALDQVTAAEELVAQVLDELPAPEAGLSVRSHRYRQALAEVVAP